MDSLRCAGNMHSSYYKWNMAIICNPPIMLCATFVPCFCIQLLVDDIDQLSRDGFDWIIKKVIFKVWKVRFGPYPHNNWYSVVTRCCPILLHHVFSLVWNESWPKIWKVWSYSKGHFKVKKVLFGPLLSIWANISETVHAIFFWNTYTKSYLIF